MASGMPRRSYARLAGDRRVGLGTERLSAGQRKKIMSRRLAAIRNLTSVAVIAISALLGSACSQNTPPVPAAIAVTPLTISPHPVTFLEDYVGQTEALNAVEIRPRVGGMLEKRVPIE